MSEDLSTLTGCRHPLVGFSRSPGVVAAVSKEGGLGVLAAAAYTAEELDRALRWIADEVGQLPFGIDVLVPQELRSRGDDFALRSLQDAIPEGHRRFVEDLLDRHEVPETDRFVAEGRWRSGTQGRGDRLARAADRARLEELLDVAFSHPIRLIANALGPPPAYLVERAHAADVAVAALAGEVKHALRHVEADVDIVVAQGTEAGGHTGTITTMVLTPDIVDAVAPRPVLAAGGIASGRQMAAALALGAVGVWTGSVWLSSEEDITLDPIKRKFLTATAADTVRSKSRTGKPARQLRSAWHDAWEAPGAPEPLPLPLQPLLVQDAWNRIDAAAVDGHKGAIELESFIIGQVVGRLTELRPAAEIAREILDGCAEVCERLGQGGAVAS